MSAGGQTINDRILAARHSLAGQGLAKAVCKATTEELIGPKRKHLDYLLRCTEEPNVSIPTLANLLLERVQNPNWIVVFKALVTLHHLMCYGNERFTQYLASSNTNFQLSNFLDRSGVQGTGDLVRGYDMSPFVRRYAKYLAEKSVSYRTVAFDFCKVKRGKDGGTLRKMSTEKLLKTLPTLHDQLDALLEFEATAADLNNGVINAAFMLLFRDLIRLFACYNDGIINLLEKFFEMNKKNARDALDIYKRFLIRMDRVGEFLKVAESVGLEKGDIPDLAKAPSSLLEALEAHLANLEGRKPGSTATSPTGAAGSVNISAAFNALSSTSSAFGNSSAIDEKLEKKLLQEEEQAMMKYKEQAKTTNPFAAPEPAAAAGPIPTGEDGTPNILDLFGMPDGGAPAPAAAAASSSSSSANKASDDLLMLSGNPFASVLSGGGSAAPAAAAPANNGFNNAFGATDNTTAMFGMSQQMQSHPAPPLPTAGGQMFLTAPSSNSSPFGAPAPLSPMSPFSSNGATNGSNGSFAAFPLAGSNGNGTMMQQQSVTNNNNGIKNPADVGASFFGDILQPQGGANGNGGSAGGPQKIVSGDLDASLANLTSNLNLSTGQSKAALSALNKPKGPPMASVIKQQQQQPAFPRS